MDTVRPSGNTTYRWPIGILRALEISPRDLGVVGWARYSIRRVSTVLSGMLYLAELDNQEYMLRTGEELQFKESYGLIRILSLEEDQLSLQFHGRVRGLTTGWEDSRKNLMPNYLEWLSARHSLALLWSTTISLFLLFLGILRWWRKTE